MRRGVFGYELPTGVFCSTCTLEMVETQVSLLSETRKVEVTSLHDLDDETLEELEIRPMFSLEGTEDEAFCEECEEPLTEEAECPSDEQ